MQSLQEKHYASEDELKKVVQVFTNGHIEQQTKNSNSAGFSISSPEKIVLSTENSFKDAADFKSEAKGQDVSFYLFAINSGSEEEGYALTCPDTRIGNLIAYAPSGQLDEDNPFTSVFYSKLIDYVENTMETYNNITNDDVEDALNKVNNSNSSRTQGVISKVEDVTINHIGYLNDWQYNSGYSLSLTNELWWGQGRNTLDVTSQSGYWDAVYQAYGRYLNVGSATVAVAQIMAYYEYPEYSDLYELDEVSYLYQTDWYDNVSEYDGLRYNWHRIKEGKQYKYLSTYGKEEVATLMLEICTKLELDYHKYIINGETYEDDVKYARFSACLNSMGYRSGLKINYGHEVITSSIDNGRPVIAMAETTVGQEHAWVIDGYANMTCTALLNDSPIEFTYDYVHCNLGCYGRSNGFYMSGIFDVDNLPHSDNLYYSTQCTPLTGYYFSEDIYLIPQIDID